MWLELAFFVLGVLPYWWTISTREKTLAYWIWLAWCCLVWLVYFSMIGGLAGIILNLVELCLAVRGLCRTWRSGERSSVGRQDPGGGLPEHRF